MCGWYASYWNAFLWEFVSETLFSTIAGADPGFPVGEFWAVRGTHRGAPARSATAKLNNNVKVSIVGWMPFFFVTRLDLIETKTNFVKDVAIANADPSCHLQICQILWLRASMPVTVPPSVEKRREKPCISPVVPSSILYEEIGSAEFLFKVLKIERLK